MPVNIDLTVWPVDGVTVQDAMAAVRTAVEAHFAKPLLRRGFYRSELGSRIYETRLVKNYAFGGCSNLDSITLLKSWDIVSELLFL